MTHTYMQQITMLISATMFPNNAHYTDVLVSGQISKCVYIMLLRYVAMVMRLHHSQHGKLYKELPRLYLHMQVF